MNKRIVILLALLATGIVFAGQAEARLLVTSVNTGVSLPLSNSLHSTASDAFPNVPDMIISDMMSERALQPYWIRSAQYQRQIYNFGRMRHGLQLTANGGGKLVRRGGQSRLVNLDLLSESLSLLSPPGLILRL